MRASSKFTRISAALTAAVLTGAWSANLRAQNRPALPKVGHVQALNYRSTPKGNDGIATRLVAEKRIQIAGASGLGLEFGDFRLGEGSLLELVANDGESAPFDADTLMRNSHSPYFNGDSVLLRVWAAPDTRDNYVSVRSVSVLTKPVAQVGIQTLCGSDTRIPSTDRRVGRVVFRRGTNLFVGSANLMNSRNCFTSAGHVFDNNATQHVVQFDVPASASNGAIVNPPASRQWSAIGTSSTTRFQNTAIGQDWAVFLTSVNSTGQHVGTARGAWFGWTSSAPLPSTLLTIRGYGSDTTPSRTRNFTQQSARGPLLLASGSVARYRVDTEGGVSGSAVYYVSGTSTRMFAVHTNGGCTSFPTTFNQGTLLSYAPFRAALIDLSSRRGDLRIDVVSPSTTSMRRGSTYSASVRTRNAGTNACIASNTGIYLSTNNTITTSDTLLASTAVPALLPGAGLTSSRSIRIPTNAQLGTCYLGAIADRTSLVSESSESNNTRAVAITCFDLPNLQVTDWTTVSSLLPGQQFTAKSTTKNAGGSTSAACTSALYFSRDSAITTSDTLLTTYTTPSLKADESRTIGHGANAPRSLPVGTCYLGIYVDHANRVAETVETDNTRSARVTCLSPVADFAIANFSVSTTSLLGSRPVTAKLGVTNVGNVSAKGARHGFYLSSDSTISGTDTLLASAVTTTLGVRATQQLALSGTVPASVRSGTCYLGAFLDSASVISELSEANNTRALRATCVGRPDLTPTLLVPSRFVAGSRIIVRSTIRNIGGAASPSGVVHALMLSTDTHIDANDVLLTRFETASINAGAASTSSLSVVVPAHFASGTYHIGLLADVVGAVTEVSEVNNIATGASALSAYTGTSKFLHFVPRLAYAADNALVANFRLASNPAHAPMSITAPSLPSHLHLTLWSGSSNYVQDFFTEFSLGLINSPLMPNWFGALDASGRRTNLALSLPQATGFVGYTVYTHVVFIKPDFSAIVAFSTNSLRNTIAP